MHSIQTIFSAFYVHSMCTIFSAIYVHSLCIISFLVQSMCILCAQFSVHSMRILSQFCSGFYPSRKHCLHCILQLCAFYPNNFQCILCAFDVHNYQCNLRAFSVHNCYFSAIYVHSMCILSQYCSRSYPNAKHSLPCILTTPPPQTLPCPLLSLLPSNFCNRGERTWFGRC